jgi:DNA topoisomerase IB
MEARHLTFSEGKAHINYVGKAGKDNQVTVTDPKLVRALKALATGKGPNDRVFPGVTSDSVAAVLPKGVKTKDLRTIVATSTAERLLGEKTPKLTGDRKSDARQIIGILKSVSTDVSKQLNNTPAMARRSYIAPQVIKEWGKKHGIREEWLE